MKIEIELGYSHIRDAIHQIDARVKELAKRQPKNQDRIGLQHLRNALYSALDPQLQQVIDWKIGRRDAVR